MRRRKFIRTTGLGALTAWAGSSVLMKACHTEEDMIGEPTWIVEGSFDRPLAIPPVVTGDIAMQAQHGQSDLLKGTVCNTFCYNPGILGPTIRTSRGETVNVSLYNNLIEPTNIHWRGLILPQDSHGHSAGDAAPGQSAHYILAIDQRAGTYWYHPRPHGSTARQVFMGLSGMVIINDPEEARLNLPSGEYEIPMIIQDKRFSDNSLDYSPTDDEKMEGYLGERIVVNGVHAPMLNISAAWYRFRIVNGSTARVFNLGCTETVGFHVIGADGGLLPSPEKVDEILLAPGERLDVLADFSALSAGKEAFLVSKRFSKYKAQGRQGFKIMKFKINGPSIPSFSLPSGLAHIPYLNPASALKTRKFDISTMAEGGSAHGMRGGHAINGKMYDMNRIDETVTAGTTEIWEFDNMMGDEIHPMHVQGVQFQVIHRMGGRNRIIASEKGWKDSVLVLPGEMVQVIMTFPETPGIFTIQCNNLEHEDAGMMLNYRII